MAAGERRISGDCPRFGSHLPPRSKGDGARRKHPHPENYHEWRKRVKEHWYHVRLLEVTVADGGYEKSLKELETALGEDHNLVLLQEK